MKTHGMRAAWVLASLMVPLHAWGQDCTLTLSNSDIDVGQFNRTTLPPAGGERVLPAQRLALHLLCTSEQDLTLAYHATAAPGGGFDWGIPGRYRLRVVQALVDEQPVEWAAAGRASSDRSAYLEDIRGLKPLREGAVVRGTRLSAQLEIQGSLDRAVLGAAQAQQGYASGSLAVAGQRRELRLRVGFAPAACRPSLSGGGRVDFGRINTGELHRDAATSFVRQTLLEVNCDAATRFALRAVDNRAGTANDRFGTSPAALFGIGRTATGEALGGFTARIEPGTGQDGETASTLRGDATAQAWRHDPKAMLHHDGQLLAFGRSQATTVTPDAWSGLSIPMSIELHLPPARELDLREHTPIDGSATLEIFYL